MPMPAEMGFEFTGTEKQDIINHFLTGIAILNAKRIVQLTSTERQEGQSVAETREPYVDKGINTLAPDFPNLQPGYLSFSDALKNQKMTGEINEVLIVL